VSLPDVPEALRSLVERISSSVDDAGRWSISSDEVARLLGLEPVAFWRAVHGVRDRISFADAIDGWTQDSVGDLVTILERLFGAGPEEALTAAGLFMTHGRGVQLTEELLFCARRFSVGHTVREEELAAMLRHTGNVQASVGIYLQEHVDIEALIRECAESFRILHELPPVGRATAVHYLHRMFTRHVLDRRGLVGTLAERLKLAAAAMGYVDPEDRAGDRRRTSGGRHGESDRHAWARRVMGLGGGRISAEDLRASYRRLMMRYHPDVDPSGLERCKDINVAYALLINGPSTEA
jgi:hypothetical protein